MNNDFTDRINEWLRAIGIGHPIYFITLLGVPWLCYAYRKDFRNWRTIDRYRRINLLGVLLAIVVGIILSLLTMFGVIPD